MDENKKNQKEPVLGFKKDKILSSKKYQKHRDVLSVILEEDRKYSHKQVNDTLSKFYKSEVK